MGKTQRQKFFDKQVHLPEWKDAMSGKNEDKVIEAIEACGYKLKEDFVRQYPMGDAIVVDIAFVDERLAIEVDGGSHLSKKQQKKDDARDRFLVLNGWVPLRIQDKNFDKNPSYFKFLIKEVVEERRRQLEMGYLYEIEVKDFSDEEYYF